MGRLTNKLTQEQIELYAEEGINAEYMPKGKITLVDTLIKLGKLEDIEEKNSIDLITLFKNGIENVSDGYHTFNDLYFQRLILFATLVNLMPEKCWKTFKHEDNELCFGGGWFLITIETPKGNYGYHFENQYWDYFKCKEIEKAKPFDGYTDKDVERLLSLTKEELEKE